MCARASILLVSSILGGSLSGRSIAQAQDCKLQILPPHAEVGGRPLGDWGAAWWQWVLNVPKDRNPITDTTGEFAHEGQAGDVFFLGGNFGGKSDRQVTIPCGKRLFFPFLNVVGWVPADCVDCDGCRTVVRQYMDGATLIECEIDGAAVENLGDHREESVCFPLTVPPENVFGLPPGVFEPAIADGFYLMLEPLCPGKHTLHFRGRIGPAADPTFELEVTYDLTVEACGAFRRGDANSDGGLNLSDAVFLLDGLFRGGSPAACHDAADMNDDGALNLTDAVYVLDYLFRGGTAPPPPGPAGCKEDPTLDELPGCTVACN